MNHDTNFAYYDSGKIFFHKLERSKSEKRFVLYPIQKWADEIKSLWKIDISDIDDFIFQFDPTTMLPNELKHQIKNELIQKLNPEMCNFLGVPNGWFIGHHYSHALSTWMVHHKQPDVSIVIDGLGDGRPWSVFVDNRLIAHGNIDKGSIGWEIRDAGKLLGIKAVHQNDIAGKLMSLQSYGKLDEGFLKILQQFSMEDIKELYNPRLWLKYKNDELVGKYTILDWIHTVHYRTGQCIVEFFKKYANKKRIVSYSGGVAQNVVWNSMLKDKFSNLIIPPHASDEGISLGAIDWLRKYHDLSKPNIENFPYSESDITPNEYISEKVIEETVDLLVQGKIVGLYQGHGEIGPRALGNRSILMDPRIENGKDLINKIKKRENYRPFGASVLKKCFSEHFQGHADNYMMYTCFVKSSKFPAITHVDMSCRVQLVDETNNYFYKLLTKFYEKTGCPMLLNTSLNLAGKPIAGYPQEALQLFYGSTLDAVVIGNNVYQK